VNLILSNEAGDKLIELAGGERRRGAYISDLVTAIYEHRQRAENTAIELLSFAELASTVQSLDGRLSKIEKHLGRLVAKGEGDTNDKANRDYRD
jgi:hypothetical protein